MMRGNSLLSSAPRMSLSALNTLEDQERQVRIWLLGSTEVKGTVFYRIAGRFHASGQTWQVNRRYSEFLVLRDTLVKYFSRTTDTCPGCLNYLHAIKQFDFPKKHFFVSKSQLVVNYRIQALRSFMNLLASWAFSNSPKCPTCGGFAFDIVRNFCLEGAEAMGDSNMSYIRDSFVVSTFTDAGRRSSLSRRNSFIPASNSHTLNAQREQQHRRSDTQHRNTVAGSGRPSQPYRQQSHGDDYERDGGAGGGGGSSRGSRSQQPRQPPQRASSSTGSGRTPQQSTAGSAQASSITGSFLFYQDGVEPGHSAADSQRPSTANGTIANGSQRGGTGAPPSTGSRRGILKNWNDVRQDRTQNNSYQSLGGDSAASLDPSDGDYKAPSSGRGQKKTRNDARSDNDSYFSLGASSGHSRDEDDYTRASSTRTQKPSNGHNAREHERQRQQQQQQQQYQQQQRDMRDNDRSLNDSYLSLGASSTSGDLEDEYHSHHPSVLPSPANRDAMFVQPPPTQKYVGGSSKKPRSPPPSTSSQRQSQRARSPPPSSQRQSHSQRTRSPPPSSQRKSQRHRSPPPPQYHDDDDDDEQPRRHHQPQQQQQPQKQKQVQSRKQPPPPVDESFATDSFIDESLRFDGMGPIAVDDVSDSDDDEIDVTGLAIDARAPPRKSTSGQDLWQPWELAKAG